MDDKIYNDTITIESVEQKDNRISLVAHNRNRYSFWTTKKDGTVSAPYSQFQSMGLRKGVTVRIGYVIEIYQDKQGVTRESKKIINFQETNETPSQTPSHSESPRGEANRGQYEESRQAFGRRLGVHGFINALLSNPAVFSPFTSKSIEMVDVIKLAIQIEDEAEKQLNPSAFRQAVIKRAPSVIAPDIQEMADQMADEDHINVEDIPF